MHLYVNNYKLHVNHKYFIDLGKNLIHTKP